MVVHRASPAKVQSEDTLRDSVQPPRAVEEGEEDRLVQMKPGRSSISPEIRVIAAS